MPYFLLVPESTLVSLFFTLYIFFFHFKTSKRGQQRLLERKLLKAQVMRIKFFYIFFQPILRKMERERTSQMFKALRIPSLNLFPYQYMMFQKREEKLPCFSFSIFSFFISSSKSLTFCFGMKRTVSEKVEFLECQLTTIVGFCSVLQLEQMRRYCFPLTV